MDNDRLDDEIITEDSLKEERETLERRTRELVQKNTELSERMKLYMEAKELEKKDSEEIELLKKEAEEEYKKYKDPNISEDEKRKIAENSKVISKKIADLIEMRKKVIIPKDMEDDLNKKVEESSKEFEELCGDRGAFNEKVGNLKSQYISEGKDASLLDSLLLEDISNKNFDELYDEFVSQDKKDQETVSRSEADEPIVNDSSRNNVVPNVQSNENSPEEVIVDEQNEKDIENSLEQELNAQREMIENMTRKFVISKEELSNELSLYNENVQKKNEYKALFANIVKEIRKLEKIIADPELDQDKKDDIQYSIDKLYQNRDVLADLYERIPKTRSADEIKKDLDKTVKEFENINKQRDEYNKRVLAIKEDYEKYGKDTSALDALLLEDISEGKDNDYLTEKYGKVPENNADEAKRKQQEAMEEVRRLQKELEEEKEESLKRISEMKEKRAEKEKKKKRGKIAGAIAGLAIALGFTGLFGFGTKRLNKGNEEEPTTKPEISKTLPEESERGDDELGIDIGEYLENKDKNITITIDDDDSEEPEEITEDEEQIGINSVKIPIPEVNQYKVPPESAEFNGDEEQGKSETIKDVDTEDKNEKEDVIDHAANTADLDKRVIDENLKGKVGKSVETVINIEFAQSDKNNEEKKEESSIKSDSSKNSSTIQNVKPTTTDSTSASSTNQTNKANEKDANSFKQGLQEQVTKPSDAVKTEERTQKTRSSNSKSSDVKEQTATSSNTEKETKQSVNTETKTQQKNSDMKQETKADMTR